MYVRFPGTKGLQQAKIVFQHENEDEPHRITEVHNPRVEHSDSLPVKAKDSGCSPAGKTNSFSKRNIPVFKTKRTLSSCSLQMPTEVLSDEISLGCASILNKHSPNEKNATSDTDSQKEKAAGSGEKAKHHIAEIGPRAEQITFERKTNGGRSEIQICDVNIDLVGEKPQMIHLDQSPKGSKQHSMCSDSPLHNTSAFPEDIFSKSTIKLRNQYCLGSTISLPDTAIPQQTKQVTMLDLSGVQEKQNTANQASSIRLDTKQMLNQDETVSDGPKEITRPVSGSGPSVSANNISTDESGGIIVVWTRYVLLFLSSFIHIL